MKLPNPDMYYNRASVLEYLERYTDAALNFQTAHKIDPTLHGEGRADQILNFVSKTCNLIKTKGKLKSKQQTIIAKTIP